MKKFEITTITQENSKLIIQTNFEEAKAEIEKTCSGYKDLIITEDNVLAAKKDAKLLAGMRLDIEEYRKSHKKELEEPIKQFEQDCKTLVNIITETETPLLEQIKVFDDERRAKKRQEAQDLIDKKIEELHLRPKFANALQVKEEYLLVKQTKKAVREDIEHCAENLLHLQEREDEELKRLGDFILQENSSLKAHLHVEKYLARLENDEDIDDLLKEVKETADERREGERAAAEAAKKELEEQRLKEEAERKQKEAEEQRQIEEAAKTGQMPLGNLADTSQSDIGCIMTPPTQTPNPDVCNQTVYDCLPDEIKMQMPNMQTAMPEQQVNPAVCDMWAVSFTVKGSFSDLRKLNQYLKQSNIQFTVVNQTRL